MVVILLSAFGFSKAPYLPINLSLSNLLPEDNPAVKEMNTVSDDIGGVGHLMVLLGPMDRPQQFLEPIAEKIQLNKEVKYVFYNTEEYLLEDKSLYILEKKEFKKLRRNAKILFDKGKSSMMNFGLETAEDREDNITKAKQFFRDFKKDNDSNKYFLSKDKKYALLLVKPIFESVDLSRSETLSNQVESIVASILKGKKFNIIGRYVEKVRDTKQMERDIGKTGIFSTIVISLLLFLGLGSLRAALVTISGVILALGFTTGIAYYLVGQINILTGFLLAILAGLGADYGIHLIRRYYQEINEGLSKEEALLATYSKTGRALFSAALTTAIAFLCLYISEFRGFSELGIIAGFGIISIFIVFMSILPASGKVLNEKIFLQKTVRCFGFYPFKVKHLKFLLLAIPFLVYGAFQTEFEYDFTRMRDLSKETRDLKALSETLYGKSTSPAGILAPDKKTAEKVVKFIEQKKYKEIVQDVVSIRTIIPKKIKSRARKVKKLKNLVKDISDQELHEKTGIDAKKIRSWLEVGVYTREDLPPHIKNSFGKSGSIVLIYPNKELDTRDELNEFATLLRATKKEFPKTKIGSDTLVFVEILDHIVEDGKVIIIMFLIGAFITFLIDFKSISSALTLEIQLILGISVLFGLMGLFEVRFTIMNVGMFPAILASGIDMGVHIHHRELESYNSLKSSKLSAQAIHLSLATTLIGFGSLFLAEAKLLNGIAWISVLGQIGMYFICMMVRPVFLNYLSWKTINKKRRPLSIQGLS
ncbi:MAG: MMPL family transporter [Bacteriovoracaceae bacterium]|nr:MMPL family transporter [Bacteriovoracaceae bacterium]